MNAAATRPANEDDLVLQHIPLVKSIAVRIAESLPVYVDLDDLIHAGVVGLMDAVRRYDGSRQIGLAVYAKHRIRGAILDSLRDMDWATRDLRRRRREAGAAERDLTQELGRAPEDAEMAERLGIDEDRWRTLRVDLRKRAPEAVDALCPRDDGGALPDFPAPETTRPDAACAHEQMRQAVANALEMLPERYRRIVFLYYNGEMTMKEIGGVLGVNESRISQIHRSALAKLAAALHAAGIHSSGAVCWNQ